MTRALSLLIIAAVVLYTALVLWERRPTRWANRSHLPMDGEDT